MPVPGAEHQASLSALCLLPPIHEWSCGRNARRGHKLEKTVDCFQAPHEVFVIDYFPVMGGHAPEMGRYLLRTDPTQGPLLDPGTQSVTPLLPGQVESRLH